MPRCHMIGSHWFFVGVVLLILWESPLAPPTPKLLKYRIRLCSKTSKPQYIFFFKFWSWFLNENTHQDVPPATTERCDIYDIFPLGRCDHSGFPLCPQSHLLKSTNQTLTKCKDANQNVGH
jgi:hypothetical protein